MGMYVNIGNAGFQSVRKGRYIDKSGLITFINETLGTKDKLTCVSRPRRFGKSFATQMLCAYYDKSCDSRELFCDLEIAKEPSFETNLNKFDVIYLDITWFISTVKNVKNTVSYLQEQVIRGLFKSSLTDKMIEAAYMTGILPIKKYGTQSALTDFREYTMIQPKKLARYVGFTEEEVKSLCDENGLDFEEAKNWYDGYTFSREQSVYSPNSVMQAIQNEEFGDYWTETETYESLKNYIGRNEDGLRDAIITMLGGARCKINTRESELKILLEMEEMHMCFTLEEIKEKFIPI